MCRPACRQSRRRHVLTYSVLAPPAGGYPLRVCKRRKNELGMATSSNSLKKLEAAGSFSALFNKVSIFAMEYNVRNTNGQLFENPVVFKAIVGRDFAAESAKFSHDGRHELP